MKIRIARITGLTLLAMVGGPAFVHAQWVPLAGPLDAQNFPDFLQDRMWDDILWRQPVIKGAMRKQGLDPGDGLYANQEGRASARNPRSGGTPAAGATTFRPGPRTVLEQVPAPQRAQMGKALAACDQLYGKTMQQMGVTRSPAALNDVANSTAFYVAMLHHVYWDAQAGAPPGAQPGNVQYLSNQLRRTLARGRLAGKSDVEKQRAHDSLVLSACLPFIQHTKAKKEGNQAARETVRMQAADLLSKVGLTPNSLRFNADGTVLVTPAPGPHGPRGTGG